MSGNSTHKSITIRALREHLDYAKSRLTHEKADILSIFPLPEEFSREEYAFAYLRAERLGMRAINRKLSTISWLPMQLDPSSESLGEGRSAMKRWLTAEKIIQPDSDIFGNDFMHALTRTGMGHGWDDPHFARLSTRVATLFRDLSCLVGIVYYVTWLSEHGVDTVPVADPGNLTRTAQDIATFLQSPALYEKMHSSDASGRANENGGEKTESDEGFDDEPTKVTVHKSTSHQNGASVRKSASMAKDRRAHLRLITNPMMPADGFEPAPAN